MTTAFTASNRDLRKLATSSPRATLILERGDLQRQKIGAWPFACFRAQSCPLPARSSIWTGLFGWRDKTANYNTAIFRQINKDKIAAHHDALEFPDGQVVLLTVLDEGQQATVLQLPAEPKTAVEAEIQKRTAYVG